MSVDYQLNKDFDINNLFLNLTFQSPEEEFEYRDPLIDHPSNYQMIVTKFFSKVHFPLLQLPESKKNPKIALQQGDRYLYDSYVHLQYTRAGNVEKGEQAIMRRHLKQNLFAVLPHDLNEGNFKPDYRTKIEENFKDIDNVNYIDEDLEYNGQTRKAKPLYWYHIPAQNEIYSPQELVVILNNALDAALERMIDEVKDSVEADPTFADAMFYLEGKPAMFFEYENGHLSLFVVKMLAYFIASNITFKNEADGYQRKVRIGFSRNLVKYLRGFPLATINKMPNFLNIPYWQWTSLRREKRTFSEFTGYEEDDEQNISHTYEYYVIEGDKINLADWSDYIGIAVTSTDFPVKGQIYPHFYYDPDSFDNRRRYTTKSESNIKSFTGPWADETKDEMYPAEPENVNDQYKKSVKDSIVFVKYFSPSDNLSLLNYENNDSQTTLKLDLEQTMPLRSFHMTLWLIDRYNNFEKFEYLGADDIVQMQILLQRIKGDEKENRTFIDTVELPSPVVHPVVDEDDDDDLILEPEEEEEQVTLLPVAVPVNTDIEKDPEEQEHTPEPPEIEDMEEDDDNEDINNSNEDHVYLIVDDGEEADEDNELY